MTAIALFGADGKMGYRLANNLRGSRFDVRPTGAFDGLEIAFKGGQIGDGAYVSRIRDGAV